MAPVEHARSDESSASLVDHCGKVTSKVTQATAKFPCIFAPAPVLMLVTSTVAESSSAQVPLTEMCGHIELSDSAEKGCKMRRKTVRRRGCAALMLAAATATPLICRAANTDVYVGASGTNWNNTSDWVISGTSTHVIPAAGDTAFITLSPSSLFSVTYDGNYTSVSPIFAFILDGSSSVGVVLNQGTAGDNLFATAGYTVGNSGIATFNQTAATNSLGGNLILGNASTAQGTYLLGTGASLSTANTEVGLSGHGSFSQTGGAHAVTTELYLGLNAGSSGSYALSGGTLTAPTIAVGNSGVGSFTQSGGSNTSNSLIVGDLAGATGSYNQSGGTNTPSALTISNAATTTGSYTLGPGAILSVGSGGEAVGAVGVGSFTQTGGTHTISGSGLFIGLNSNSTGSYTLSGGSLSTPAGVGEGIGISGAGSFSQTGGTNTINDFLRVGQFAGSNGSYFLGPSANLSAVNELIGAIAIGTFTQTGGTNSISNTLSVGDSSGANGKYALGGGILTAVATIIGNSGAGSFTQTGGTQTISGTLFVGNASGSTGSYALSGGMLFPGQVAVGENGVGTFTQSGGTHTIANNLFVGDQSTANGTYILSGAFCLRVTTPSSSAISAPGALVRRVAQIL
jgi:hypothetical protein